MLHLLQRHTIEIYELEHKSYQIETIKARELLSIYRFDLYAKLFYIKHKNSDQALALKVYSEHIKAFNPDWTEPGRKDKKTLNDFTNSFDKLISHFKDADFDASISMIPISENGIILDGAHRVAALAYWNKNVTIARFKDVLPKCSFDYYYFRKRGLALDLCDIIANELIQWKTNIYVACLWPRMGNSEEKQKAIKVICNYSSPCYSKRLKPTFKAFTLFIANIYKKQDWVGNKDDGYLGATDKAKHCYSFNKYIDFIYFPADNLQDVISLKETIRNSFNYEKHSIHITDTHDETLDIAFLTLSDKGRNEWLNAQKYQSKYIQKQEQIKETIYYFKNVTWLNIKIAIASFIEKLWKK